MPAKKKTTKKSLLKKKKPVEKQTPVTRAFLLKLADDIYNPKKPKRFMNLCGGKLQNGPDPKDGKRPMHCGLGELYLAMTGLQPNELNVDEEKVCRMAVERSTLFAQRAAAVLEVEQLQKNLTKSKTLNDISLHLSELVFSFKNNLKFANGYLDDYLGELYEIFVEIPNVNDQFSDVNEGCNAATYEERAQAVADAFRKAARLLPS